MMDPDRLPAAINVAEKKHALAPDNAPHWARDPLHYIERLRAMARPKAAQAPGPKPTQAPGPKPTQAPGPKPTLALEVLPARHQVENRLLADALMQLEAQLCLLDGKDPQPTPEQHDQTSTGLVARIEHLLEDTTALRLRLVAAADRLQAILQGPATRLSS